MLPFLVESSSSELDIDESTDSSVEEEYYDNSEEGDEDESHLRSHMKLENKHAYMDYESFNLNIQELPAFFSMNFDTSMLMPNELLNEPFTDNDDEYRPEIIVPRGKFHYVIHDGMVSCTVRSTVLEGSDGQRYFTVPYILPKKRTSKVSVLNIYDTYGLQIAYLFLKYLYYHKYHSKHPQRLIVYLRGSLNALNSNNENGDDVHDNVLYLSSLIMMELLLLESKNPMIVTPIVPVPEGYLTNDVLSLIIKSNRVSKKLSGSAVYHARPSEAEMYYGAVHPMTMHLYHRGKPHVLVCWTSQGHLQQLSLIKDYEYYHFKSLTGDEVKEIDEEGYISTFSVFDYEKAYSSSRCVGKREVISMLMDIKRSCYNDSNGCKIDDMCGWIVQLSYDLEELESRTLRGREELYNEFERLIYIAKEKLSDELRLLE